MSCKNCILTFSQFKEKIVFIEKGPTDSLYKFEGYTKKIGTIEIEFYGADIYLFPSNESMNQYLDLQYKDMYSAYLDLVAWNQ